MVAEGADAAAMSRSVPLAKAMDDALVCLYQNGERVRPSNGYPIRLLLPGFEGNMNVKWLRRLKLTDAPVMTKDETSKYTMLLPGRKGLAVRVPDGGEVDHHPSVARPRVEGAGLLRDLRPGLVRAAAASARSRCRPTAAAAGRRRRCRSRCCRRRSRAFARPWQWSGGPAVLQSRATDETGMVQPTRAQFVAERGLRGQYHYNAIARWRIDEKGEATNVIA